MKRVGSRGENDFQEISWEEALGEVAEAVARTIAEDRGGLVLVSGTSSVLLRGLLRKFAGALGAPAPIFDRGLGAEVEETAARAVLGFEGLPVYDLFRSDFVLSIGAPLFDRWRSPVHYAAGFSRMRRAPETRGRLVQAEPRLSATAATADQWLPLLPGSEGFLARALAGVVMRRGLAAPAAVERYRNADFWAFYDEAHARGGVWTERPPEPVTPPLRDPVTPFEVSAPRFEGGAAEYPFRLVAFESVKAGDGRGANRPWLQEIPDPIATSGARAVRAPARSQRHGPHRRLPGRRHVGAGLLGDAGSDYSHRRGPVGPLRPRTPPRRGHSTIPLASTRRNGMTRWGMVIDTDLCTGCEACVVACHEENNIRITGADEAEKGRVHHWIRIERYFEGEFPDVEVRFRPVLCQHCAEAPCEPVCPVYATYHTPDGLNAMVYNRCVGTRFCANNCPYTVRHFNWHAPRWPEPLDRQLNPDVSPRPAGVMEKCTFCVQRIHEARDRARDEEREVGDGEVRPACASACPTQAITFGDLDDPASRVSELAKSDRASRLQEDLGTRPAVIYLEGEG